MSDFSKTTKALSVSVVIAARNASRTIQESVRSALGQSGVSVEIIVCDDASDDGTADIARSFNDPRVIILENRVNRGPGKSRDLAIQATTSPWVAVLDADDTWHPERLTRLLSAACGSPKDVIFDDLMMCHDTAAGLVSWSPLHGKSAFGSKNSEPAIVRIDDYIRSSRLLIKPIIRTEFIRKNGILHSDKRFAEDAEFHLRLGLSAANFLYVPQPLYFYRITPGSLTAEARDPSLMRRCLEDCAQWQGWTPSALTAFDEKIAALRRNESLYAIVRHIREGHFGAAFGLVTQEPTLLKAMPARFLQQLGYQMHRAMNRGHRRRINQP